MSFLGRVSRQEALPVCFGSHGANDLTAKEDGDLVVVRASAVNRGGQDDLHPPGEGNCAMARNRVGRRQVPMMGLARAKNPENRALIVFADAPDKWFLRWLPAGFRHCFAVITTGESGQWIYLNPASHQLQCELWQFSALFDPAAYYRGQGHCCVWVTLPDDAAKKVRLGMFSCVEVVKRLLGISAWYVMTPAGLYRYLVNRSKICQKSS
ncbi:hypothetical protein [uncultured Thalassospira sp.]|uniref:hypothetical protein n=1 Tax=uncultured Thalassospira sp. TaxID=404382 RepID=UPI0030D97623|tara:strand:- start:19626 stop:20255 length:630 start_codon:yes stop_codon:yes gene_type:complete